MIQNNSRLIGMELNGIHLKEENTVAKDYLSFCIILPEQFVALSLRKVNYLLE